MKVTDTKRACENPDCCASTGIHESTIANGTIDRPWGLTFGSGKLSMHGYWEHPCGPCARAAEVRHGMPVGTYWPWAEAAVAST